jgi:hypothetical protein
MSFNDDYSGKNEDDFSQDEEFSQNHYKGEFYSTPADQAISGPEYNFSDRKIEFSREMSLDTFGLVKKATNIRLIFSLVCLTGMTLLIVFVFFPSMGIKLSEFSNYSTGMQLAIICFGLALILVASIIIRGIIKSTSTLNNPNSALYWGKLQLFPEMVQAQSENYDQDIIIHAEDISKIFLYQMGQTQRKEKYPIVSYSLKIITNKRKEFDFRMVAKKPTQLEGEQFFEQLSNFVQIHYQKELKENYTDPIHLILGILIFVLTITGVILLFIYQ